MDGRETTLDQALRIAEEIKDASFSALLLSQRAYTARALGDGAGAWEDARLALRIADEVAQWSVRAGRTRPWAALYRDEGDHAASQAYYAQAVHLLRRAGDSALANEPLAGAGLRRAGPGRAEPGTGPRDRDRALPGARDWLPPPADPSGPI